MEIHLQMIIHLFAHPPNRSTVLLASLSLLGNKRSFKRLSRLCSRISIYRSRFKRLSNCNRTNNSLNKTTPKLNRVLPASLAAMLAMHHLKALLATVKNRARRLEPTIWIRILILTFWSQTPQKSLRTPRVRIWTTQGETSIYSLEIVLIFLLYLPETFLLRVTIRVTSGIHQWI